MSNITPVDLMFLLLKSCLFNGSVDYSFSDYCGYMWEEVFGELCNHRIEALPYRCLDELHISNSSLYRKWSATCIKRIGRWTQLMYSQQKLLELLEMHNIECVVIKGSAAAIYYPIPQLRILGDVDILVSRSDYNRAATIMENNGYELVGEKKSDRHHYTYRKGSVVFELHKRLAIVQEADVALISIFEKGINNREYKQLGKFSFPVLPAELNGLVLLLHIDQHLRVGIGLRQIIDWMMYVYCNGLDSITPMLQFTNREKFAYSVTAMCQKYLGLRTTVQYIEDYPCDELMAYVLKKGNFGKKSGIEGEITSAMLLADNPINLLKKLQSGGLSHWKATKRFRILRPIAWLYPLYFAITELLHRRITIGGLSTQRKEALRQRELIMKLGLDIDRMLEITEL